VVVDFNGLGGGVQQACVSGGGGDNASSLFPAAGFPLSYASRQPGFVCRVKGVPSSDPCVNTAPADAFWSLWWSDGDASSWTYSSLGAASLKIPDGGMVAFSWDDVGGNAPPSASPSHPDPAPSPEPEQPPPNNGGGGAGPDQPAAPGGSNPPGSSPSTTPDGSPSASPDAQDGKQGKRDKGDKGGKGKRDKGKQQEPEATPGETPSTPTDTEVGSGEDAGVAEPPAESNGLPGWVAPALIGALFAAAGIVLLVRRRRSGP
jgi:hypothetical protein